MLVSLGEKLTFSPPLGLLTLQDFLSSLFILTLSYSKPFYNTLNYASTPNIEEVMKFYNLGNKSFETDFGLSSVSNLIDKFVLSDGNVFNFWRLLIRYLSSLCFSLSIMLIMTTSNPSNVEVKIMS